MLRQLIIMSGHFFDEFTIVQYFSNMRYRFISDKAIEFNSLESLWFDIYLIDSVVVDKDRPSVINGFQESVAKPFE